MVGRSSRVSWLRYAISIWLVLAVACTSASTDVWATPPVATASPPAQPCQRFEPLYPAALPGVFAGTGDWADYDGDGDVDLALTAGDIGGGPDLRIYRNDGGVWHLVFTPLRPLTGSDVAWGDYDGDGDLDLAFAGHELDRAVTIIYQNRGGEFRESGVGLPSVPYGSLAWGDADGDGDLDLLLTGGDNEGGQTLILINERGRFAATATGLPALHSVYGGSLAWNDYDGDLDQDLLFVGDSFHPQAIVRIYRNDGGSLVEAGAGLPPLRYVTAAWADYDQDGDLDLALAGDADPNPGDVKLSPWAALYRNDNGFYVEAQQLAAIYGGALTWGDYDGDGDLDLYLGGLFTTRVPSTQAVAVGKLYRNDGGRLVDTGAQLPATSFGEAQWGDADGDNDLDLLLIHAGHALLTSIGDAVAVLRNTNGDFSPHWPGLPPLHNAVVEWGDYDRDGDEDLVVAGYGPLDLLARIYQNENGTLVDLQAGVPGFWQGDVAWGDYDGDSDLDLALAGETVDGPTSRIYRNEEGRFVDIAAGLPGIVRGVVAWGDYDVDGDVDLLLAGSHDRDGDRVGEPLTRLYRNEAGVFVDSELDLPNLYLAAAAWGDYDDDGDDDLILTGDPSGDGAPEMPKTYLYRNDRGDLAPVNAGLPDVAGGRIVWADYDSDHDLDLLLAGVGETLDAASIHFYRNEGGMLKELGHWPGFAVDGDFDLGDYDGDGDLDMIFLGEVAHLQGTVHLFRNEGEQFAESEIELPPVRGGTVRWGDLDGDGMLELFIASVPEYLVTVTNIYRLIDCPSALRLPILLNGKAALRSR